MASLLIACVPNAPTPQLTATPLITLSPTTQIIPTRRVEAKITEGQGYKQIEEGIIVVHLKGSEPQMRQQRESLLKNETGAFNAVIRRNRMIQELSGGCTAFAAFGSATADGKVWHGRNFDFYGLGAMDRYRVVYIVEPEGKIPFVSIGWPNWGGPEQVLDLNIGDPAIEDPAHKALEGEK